MIVSDKINKMLSNCYSDDKKRRLLMFRILNIVLGAVSVIMSVMNIVTREIVLFGITAAYAVLCTINCAISSRYKPAVWWGFCAETIVMLTTFVITGIPDGFSVLWTLIIPACALAIFGRRNGTLFSCATFLMIIFCFWMPAGKALLQYEYNATFMLRFPLVYICMYLIAFYIEWIRRGTYEKLMKTEKDYRWLYRHDALTGIFSRHAFYEEMESTLFYEGENSSAVLILDIDDFKNINDRYGHNTGDVVLKRLADIIQKNICEHCIYCRWGGEEFLIVMKCQHDPNQIAERIRQTVEDTVITDPDGRPVSFTISVGVSVGRIATKEELAVQINRADKAMYDSKSKGKNRITMEA